jgi:hypothetical protein
VSAETNEGLSGCWVQGYAQKPRQGDPQGPNFSEFEFDYSTQVSGMTNASGEFEIEDVPAGTYSFRVHHDKYAPAKVDNVRVERGSSPSPLTLALKGGITVSGRVEAPGSEKFTWSGLSFQRIDDPTMTGWAQLDERKEFNVSSLTPGKYRVWYYGSSGEDDSPTEGFDTLEVEVPAGGATGLTLRFEKAKPRTKIVPAEGK